MSTENGNNDSQLDETALSEELAKDFGIQPAAEPVSSSLVIEGSALEVAKLPRRIHGGFQGLSDDLERRSGDVRTLIRRMEYQRPYLETVEAERDRIDGEIGNATSKVRDASRALKVAMDTVRSGDVSNDVAVLFARRSEALRDLDKLVEEAVINGMALQAAWDDYSVTVAQAHRLREDIRRP